MAQIPDTEASGKRAGAKREERGEEGTSRSEEETRGASPELEDRGGRTGGATDSVGEGAEGGNKEKPPPGAGKSSSLRETAGTGRVGTGAFAFGGGDGGGGRTEGAALRTWRAAIARDASSTSSKGAGGLPKAP